MNLYNPLKKTKILFFICSLQEKLKPLPLSCLHVDNHHGVFDPSSKQRTFLRRLYGFNRTDLFHGWRCHRVKWYSWWWPGKSFAIHWLRVSVDIQVSAQGGSSRFVQQSHYSTSCDTRFCCSIERNIPMMTTPVTPPLNQTPWEKISHTHLILVPPYESI